MNLQNLRYILEIGRTGSISAAAKKLYLSQPYLSRVLSETEREYAIRIFTRTPSGLSVTKEGSHFLHMASELLVTVEQFEKSFTQNPLPQVLRISTSSASALCMEAFLPFLESAGSPFRCYYKETDNLTAIYDVLSRRSELGVIVLNNSNDYMAPVFEEKGQLEFHMLKSRSLHLLVRTGHPLTRIGRPVCADDLYPYNFVLFPYSDAANISSLGRSHYESAIRSIDWSRIRQIVYVYSRAALQDLLLRTDFVSFGSQTIAGQKEHYGLSSLPLDESLFDSLAMDVNSSLYYFHLPGAILSEPAQLLVNFLKEMADSNSRQ